MIARADNFLGPPLLTAGLTILAVVQMSGSLPHNWLGFIGSPLFENRDLFSRYQSPLQRPVYLRDTEDDYAPSRYNSDTRLPENIDYGADEPENQATPGPRIGESSRKYEMDEITALVERAIENRDFLDPEEWKEFSGQNPSKAFQRDTSSYQNTHDAKVSVGSTRDTSNYSSSRKHGIRRSDLRGEYERRMSATPIPIDSMQADEKIIFPTEDNHSQAHRFLPDPASVCKGTTYCEHSSDYPENYIQTAIRVQENLKYFTGVDEVVNIIQRIDFPPEDTPLCVSTEKVIYPKLAKNRENEWLYVINQGNFTQGVRVETCHNEGSACNVLEGVASGYKTTCKQKYIYRQLVAVTGNGTILPKMFPFEASCCCHVKFTGNVLTRMGGSLGRANQTST